ncbi:unnamed protein product, partial [Brachionus calyciflorus]
YFCTPDDLEKIKNVSNLGYECGPGGIEEYETTLLKGICNTRTLVLAWAVGGRTNVSFPENTGFRFPQSDQETIIFTSIHYDNSRLIKNHKDNSGFRFKFTRNLKKYDLGVMGMSVPTNPLDITIPPNTDSIKMTSICYSECTQNSFPDDGVTVYAGNFHTHLAGRALRAYLMRDGKLVKYLFDDQHYDFNYQSNILIQPTKLMKGDSLILECVYSTKNKNKFTFGGYGTQDEMCGLFIYYYPKIEFLGCASTIPDKEMANFYNKLIKDSIIPPLDIKLDSTNIRNNTKILVDHLRTKVKSSKELSDRYKNYYLNPINNTGLCLTKSRKIDVSFFEKEFKRPTETLNEKNYCDRV